PIAPERSVPPTPAHSIAPAPGFAKRAVTRPELPKRFAPATAIPAKPIAPTRPLHDDSVERTLRRDFSSELPSFAGTREQSPFAVSRGVLFAAAALILATLIVISGWRIFRSSGTP